MALELPVGSIALGSQHVQPCLSVAQIDHSCNDAADHREGPVHNTQPENNVV